MVQPYGSRPPHVYVDTNRVSTSHDILSRMIHDKASTTHTIITSPHDGRNIIPGNGPHQSDLSHPSQELQKTFEELKQMVTTEHTEESCAHS